MKKVERSCPKHSLSLNCILRELYGNFDSPWDKSTHPINIKVLTEGSNHTESIYLLSFLLFMPMFFQLIVERSSCYSSMLASTHFWELYGNILVVHWFVVVARRLSWKACNLQSELYLLSANTSFRDFCVSSICVWNIFLSYCGWNIHCSNNWFFARSRTALWIDQGF